MLLPERQEPLMDGRPSFLTVFCEVPPRDVTRACLGGLPANRPISWSALCRNDLAYKPVQLPTSAVDSGMGFGGGWYGLIINFPVTEQEHSPNIRIPSSVY